MECVAAILIRTTATTHKHYLNEPVYQRMISPLHLLMTGDLSTQKRKEQCPESDDGNAPVRSVLCVQEFFFLFNISRFPLDRTSVDDVLFSVCPRPCVLLPWTNRILQRCPQLQTCFSPLPCRVYACQCHISDHCPPLVLQSIQASVLSKTLCQWNVLFVRFGSFGWSDLTPSNASPLFCRTCKSLRGEGMKGSMRIQKDWEIRPEKIMRGGYVHC